MDPFRFGGVQVKTLNPKIQGLLRTQRASERPSGSDEKVGFGV